jgi:hypothetical protein
VGLTEKHNNRQGYMDGHTTPSLNFREQRTSRRPGIYRQAERLFSSQDGLFSMEYTNKLVNE